jgi:hypothetical protein
MRNRALYRQRLRQERGEPVNLTHEDRQVAHRRFDFFHNQLYPVVARFNQTDPVQLLLEPVDFIDDPEEGQVAYEERTGNFPPQPEGPLQVTYNYDRDFQLYTIMRNRALRRLRLREEQGAPRNVTPEDLEVGRWRYHLFHVTLYSALRRHRPNFAPAGGLFEPLDFIDDPNEPQEEYERRIANERIERYPPGPRWIPEWEREPPPPPPPQRNRNNRNNVAPAPGNHNNNMPNNINNINNMNINNMPFMR